MTATAKEIKELWVQHQGWGKWGSSSTRRFDAIVLERNARRYPGPVEFWQAVFARVPVGAKAVYIESGLPPLVQEVWQTMRKEWEADQLKIKGLRSIADIFREWEP